MYMDVCHLSVLTLSLQKEYDYGDETYEDSQTLNCSTSETIKDGHVTYSQGGLQGSVLTYHCGPGQYPFPVSYRLCDEDGDWSPMRFANGRLASQAKCKDVLCPAQLQLDHGDFWPRDQWFSVGATQSFSCQEGFTLYGSAQRNCTFSGEWTGTTPVCDNHGPNTFDSPSAVAEAMAGSLAGVMDVFSPDSKRKSGRRSFGRTFRVAEGSRMNVYILLDTSGSIKKHDFEIARNATIALIQKLDSYEVKLKFHVLSYASKAIDIVNITDTYTSSNIDNIIWSLLNFDYHSHGSKTGTNLAAGLKRVSEMINIFKQHSAKNHFNETQNIIIIETDGFSNTGPNPKTELAKIRSLLGYSSTSHDHTDETMLDVYVFGVGDQVNREELNSLASKKSNEMHLFVLEHFQALGKVFNSIISDKSVTMCGIAQEDNPDYDQEAYTKPWHVTLKTVKSTGSPCSGSIVSQNWVLTAAHCFARVGTQNVAYQVDVESGEGTLKSSRVILHPKYNIKALAHKNVSEFYDYDVALVHFNKSIPLSWKARPICLPCTVPASRAMKKINSTCQQHREDLLLHKETSAYFIHKQVQRKETHIHTGSQRPSCVEKARQTLKLPTTVTMDEYVPDRFLCSGGTSGYRDAITCRGDSGGSLFLQKRKRYFQVGIVSWGTTDVCDLLNPDMRGYSRDRPPPHARDFHIDLFKILPWLKQHLGKDIQFLPEVN
ncbi:Complement factor B [Channa argus]|uniref:C3/C5 convertase n=1 Tax=Channa argus TaxID=215402 RepID=A0A6G1PRT4_CHAAH|nr:Complement factor B [Channa argus]